MRNRVSLAAVCVALALACPVRATVTTTASSASYTCNGTTTAFTIPFPYLAPSHIIATQKDASGAVTTVTGTVKPAIAPSSGTLTLTTACPSGSTLIITRSVPLDQQQSLRTGSYKGPAIESALDKLTMETQQIENTTANAARTGLLTASDWIRFNIAANTIPAPQPGIPSGVSVVSYGALGDDATDNSTAFTTALASGATRIFVPDGIYRISTPLTLPNHVCLIGNGKGSSTLKFTYSNSANVAITFVDGFHQCLRDLNFDYITPIVQSAYVANGSGTAIRMTAATYASLERVRVTNFETGLRVNGEATWLSVTDMIVANAGTGYSLFNPNFTHFVRAISDTNQAGFFLQSVTKAVLDTCTAQVTYGTGVGAIQIVDSDEVEIRGLWTERNQGHGIEVKGASRLTRIYESLVQGAGWNLAAGTLTGTGDGLKIAGTSSNTLVDGGWFGGNASRDIETVAGTSKTVLLAPRSNSALVFIDAATDTTWSGSDFFVQHPTTNMTEVVPGSSSNSMSRPAIAAGWINGERGATRAGAPTSDDGFQRISAGGGTSAGVKSYIDLSGFSTLPDMNQNIVFGTAGAERARLSSTGLALAGVALKTARVSQAFTSSWTANAAAGNVFDMNVTSTGAITVNLPTNAATGEQITYKFRNNAGAAMGAVTWAAGFKLAAWTNPAVNFNRTITFEFDGTNWNEIGRTAADVPN